jgi:hypothetical protein
LRGRKDQRVVDTKVPKVQKVVRQYIIEGKRDVFLLRLLLVDVIRR